MAVKEKDANKSWFNLDSFIAGYGLRWLKSVVKRKLVEWKLMAAAQAKEEKIDERASLYFQLTDLFKHGDVADRELVEASVRIAVEVVDGLIDQLPFVPQKAKDMADDLGGDLVTEVRDHFANTDVVMPDPEKLTKIKGDVMAKEAGLKLMNLLKEFITSGFNFLKNIASQLPKMNAGFSLRPKINRFLETLFTQQDPEVLNNFSRFVDSELMVVREYQSGFYELVPDDDVQDDFVDMVENWDTFPEFVAWFSKPLWEQRQEFAKGRMLKQHAGLPRLHRDATEAIQAGGKAVAELLHLLNEKLKEPPHQKKSTMTAVMKKIAAAVSWGVAKLSNYRSAQSSQATTWQLSATETIGAAVVGLVIAVFLSIGVLCLYLKQTPLAYLFLISALPVPIGLFYLAARRDNTNG